MNRLYLSYKIDLLSHRCVGRHNFFSKFFCFLNARKIRNNRIRPTCWHQASLTTHCFITWSNNGNKLYFKGLFEIKRILKCIITSQFRRINLDGTFWKSFCQTIQNGKYPTTIYCIGITKHK